MNTREMHFSELPYYLTVKQAIDTETDAIKILVESRIHVNRIVELPTSFSIDFVNTRPNKFRSDVLNAIVRRYDLKLEPVRYS